MAIAINQSLNLSSNHLHISQADRIYSMNLTDALPSLPQQRTVLQHLSKRTLSLIWVPRPQAAPVSSAITRPAHKTWKSQLAFNSR